MRAIVTGASGFVGRYLVKELLASGYHVFPIVRDRTDIEEIFAECEKLTIIRSNLENIHADLFPNGPFDVFFHMAWHGVNRNDINDDNIHEISHNFSARCLRLAEEIGCKVFCDSGSRAEYGIMREMKEDALCQPIEAYGRWKLKFYEHAYDFCKQNNLKYLHFRIFSVMGVGDHPWSLISNVCNAFVKNESIEFGPCEQLWNYMAVEDAVKAMRLAYENIHRLDKNDNCIVNIASYDTRILRSFIEEIFQITNSESELSFRVHAPATTDVVPNIKKLSTLTDWKSEIPFYLQIKKILESG